MGNLQPGESIVLDHVGNTVDGAGVGDTPDHKGDTNIRHNDGVTLSLGEEDRVGIEVVGPFGVGFLAGDVED